MKILYVTTISNTMEFFPEHIKMMQAKGNVVELACCMQRPFSSQVEGLGCKFHELAFSRNPLSPQNIKGYRMLRQLVKKEGYDLVHCHTPIAAACTRLACRSARKKGLKVMYTAHGFHFFKGATLKNWLLFYPMEKLCAKYTDALITINKEDYALAQRKMKAKTVHYVPGVGIDVAKFANAKVNKNEKREELGLPYNAFVLLSVGELNRNKNHEAIVRAMALLRNPAIHYIIAGNGGRKEYLLRLAESLGISQNIHLLGFRRDIAELCKTADVFCFPSYREGLSVAVMEAMVSGLPVVCSDIRGNNDLIHPERGGYLCAPFSVEGFAAAIGQLAADAGLRESFGNYNKEAALQYGYEKINQLMFAIYESTKEGV